MNQSNTATPTPECLYCTGKSLVPHFDHVRDRLRHVPGEWAFTRCTDCGSLLLSPFPKAEDIPSFYPPVYSFSLDSEKNNWFKQFLLRLEYHLFYAPQYQAQARHVLRGTRWSGEQGLKLLDVGCGRGLRLRAFQRRGFDVHGVDMQPEVVEYVIREIGVAASVGGIESLNESFDSESFDLISAFYLLEHVPNVREVLERCLSLLRPGGWFVGVVPICDGLQARIFKERWIHVQEAPRHLSLPSKRGLIQAAEESGYQNVSIGPDAILNCAGIVGGSLMPGSDLTATYGGGPGRAIALAKRLFGAGLAVGAIPFCALENYFFQQTSHGMLFAQRPTH